jgi:hypothetical protein
MERLQHTIQPILDILDDGLRLYRQGFVLFVLLTALAIVPLSIVSGWVTATDNSWQNWIALLVVLLAFLLAVYMLAAISRATLLLQQGRSVALREALRISPLRLAGMGCYGLLFWLFVSVLASVIFFACFCSALVSGVFSFGGALAVGDSPIASAAAFLLGVLIILTLVLFYIAGLVLIGATYGSVIYALQPFVQQDGNSDQLVRLSSALLAYRFRFNLLAFLITSSIFSAISLAVSVAIGVLVPLPLFLALGDHSPIAQGVSMFAWFFGFIVVVPPMPIWMTLLYQRNYASRAGSDLQARIAALTTTQAAHEAG